MNSKARIQSVRKEAPSSSERMLPVEETLAKAKCIAAEKGITRLGDITGLDRIGLPVYTSVVPKSDDTISVYSGKGLTPIDSRTGALMEAIERQTALHADVPVVEGSARDLRRRKHALISPRTFNYGLKDDYSEDRQYWWIEGHDLIADETVLVPAALAGYGSKYIESHSPYEIYTSNGLASGNCFEEAVCHALCELIERDAWTLAELRSQWIPWARREALLGREIGSEGWDDPGAHPRIDLRSAGEALAEIICKFERSGLGPVIRDITSDLGISCVIASVHDDSVPGFPQAHSGLGAHPNARIAAIRALTELAQSRVVDIQSVREDILPAGIDVAPPIKHTQRLEKIDLRRWTLQQAGTERPFRAISSVENEDIADDIRLILSRLTQHGIERVIVVDFSEPGPFSVVRVLVPGLEFWALDQGKLGPRAVQFWRQHV